MSDPLPIPDDWPFMIEHHRPVCVRLRRLGIPAYEEGSGGGNFHVAFPREGRFILADCNDGPWVAGVYVSHDDAYEGEHGNALHESDLDEDAEPTAVVEWLLGLSLDIVGE
jgi:hypothetical protein